MNNELYEQMYQYVVSSLYDVTLGLRIKYSDVNGNREKEEEQNIEVFEYMSNSVENERKIVDKIINKGVRNVESFQYIINDENLKRFLTPSAMIPMAREAYQEIKLEEQQGLDASKKSSL